MTVEITQQVEATEEQLIDRARQAVESSAWIVGECASKWTEKYSRGRSDTAFGDLVGLTGEQVRQRRAVWNRFGISNSNWKLSFTHCYTALNWTDADACLSWSADVGATVAEMKAWRRARHGEDLTQSATRTTSRSTPATPRTFTGPTATEPHDPIVTPDTVTPNTVAPDTVTPYLNRPLAVAPLLTSSKANSQQSRAPSDACTTHQAPGTRLSVAVRQLRSLVPLVEEIATPARRQAVKELSSIVEKLDPQNTEVTNDQFEQWWQLYPRRKGKGQARRAFRTAARRVGYERLCDATRAFAADCAQRQTDIQYIPHPATWLNGERWDDEADAAGPATGRTEQTIGSLEAWLCSTADHPAGGHTLPALH